MTPTAGADDAASSLLPPTDGFGPGQRRILIAAVEVVAERGAPGASIREIASTAGIRSATLYDHFANKDEIIARVVEIGYEAIRDAVVAAIDEADDDPVAQVRAAIAVQIRLYCRYPQLAVVANDAIRSLPRELADRAWQLRQEAQLAALVVIDRGMRSGAFDVPNPPIALASIGSMTARVPHWFVPSPQVTVDDLVEQYQLFALRLLGHPDRAPSTS